MPWEIIRHFHIRITSIRAAEVNQKKTRITASQKTFLMDVNISISKVHGSEVSTGYQVNTSHFQTNLTVNSKRISLMNYENKIAFCSLRDTKSN